MKHPLWETYTVSNSIITRSANNPDCKCKNCNNGIQGPQHFICKSLTEGMGPLCKSCHDTILKGLRDE